MKLGLKQALRAALVLVFVTAMAKPAAADWLLTPYFGIVFSGAANTIDVATFDEAFEQRANFGLSASGMAKGIFGWEADISYTPNFFQLTEGGEDFEFFNVDSSLTTVMGNLVLGIPIGGTTGGVRPYFTADDPLADDDFFDEDFALEDFDFWRATIGITFRFGG